VHDVLNTGGYPDESRVFNTRINHILPVSICPYFCGSAAVLLARCILRAAYQVKRRVLNSGSNEPGEAGESVENFELVAPILAIFSRAIGVLSSNSSDMQFARH
jgi:hypothetical protein